MGIYIGGLAIHRMYTRTFRLASSSECDGFVLIWKRLKTRSKEIEASLLSRGYDIKSLKQASEKALVTPRSETLTYKVKLGHKRPPMVVTHNPCNPPLKQWVAELQRDVINRMRRVLPEPPLIAERNCKSLKNHLMPTRLPAPLDAVTGNFKCDRSKCLICQQHLVETGADGTPRGCWWHT